MNYFLECVYSFIGSICFGIIFNIQGRKLFYSGLGGALSQGAYIAIGLIIKDDITRYLFATIITAIYAEVLARVEKTPATVILVPSIIPLVPGGMLYYTMEYCILGEISKFISMLLETLGIAGALAMGILVVSSGNKLMKVAAGKRRKLIAFRK